jgi:glycine betaine/choline ABC-type transport system substrate-binding protein
MCTEQLIVNYFIVDHVCLKEGNKRKGMTCFCEEDFCNSAISRHRFDLFWAYLGLVAAVHLLLRVG